MNTEEIIITAENPFSLDAVQLMNELSVCLQSITGDSGQNSFNVEDVCVPRSMFAIARNPNGESIGCGAFRPLDEKTAEIKRMYVREKSSGVGSMLLFFLENQAAQMGYEALLLSTRLVNLGAVSFYERNGYRRIPGYGRYLGRPESVCFEKHLPGSNPSSCTNA
jgi:ribosomal protein S18 acetylase RimI-like enzyme